MTQKILTIINSYLRDTKHVSLVATPESHLKDDLNFDSLDAVEISCMAEEQMKVSVPIEDLVGVAPQTVQDIINFFEKCS